MTDTADTPIARAAKIIRDGRASLDAESLARAALTAALRVRWAAWREKDGAEGANAWLGSFCIAEVFPCRGKYYIAATWESDAIETFEEAKSAVERAILKAILGETI